MQTDDTIVALATPSGRGGIGIVRLSGQLAMQIAQKVLRRSESNVLSTSDDHQDNISEMTPWRVHYAELCDEQGGVVDQVLATSFRKPHSYTAENIVEISCHGSPVVLQFLVERCLKAGARLAEPGEFTLRAFLNGRIDLTQAEAICDLIDAQTLYQAKVAAQQMKGAVSHRIAPLKRQLVELISLLEAGIDFADDDVPVLPAEEIASQLKSIQQGLEKLRESYRTGKIIHQGLILAIVGRPNVGKSSLFNCLLGQDRAIVTATPGTTRDLVSETIELNGIPLRFVDTAGIREAFDEAESIGIRKSYEAAADSDLALVVLDAAETLRKDDGDLLEQLSGLGKLLVVVNKCDLPMRCAETQWTEEIHDVLSRAQDGYRKSRGETLVIFVSAKNGAGMDELQQAVLKLTLPALSTDRESQYLTNVRQEGLLGETLAAFAAAYESLLQKVPHEMLLLDLYKALRPLDAITGETTMDDILGNIFSTFCIGK